MRHALRTLAVLSLALLPGAALAQPSSRPSPTPSPGSFQLAVAGRVPEQRVTLRAERAPLPAVAAEIGKRLRLRIRVAADLARETVTLDLRDATVEDVLARLAPQAWLDLSVRSDAPGRATPLLALLEPAPGQEPPAAVLRRPLVLVFEGDTEDPGATDVAASRAEQDRRRLADDQGSAPALHVVVLDGRVSVRARQQTLPAILHAVAERAGVVFQLDAEPGDPIDLELSEVPLEQLPASLPPGVRFFLRKDLRTGGVAVTRIDLTAPERRKLPARPPVR